MKPTNANVRYLLSEYARILDELRKTEVIRSKNNPLADYAEWLTGKALKLELCTKSTKGHDATKGGIRYEIKARRVTADNGSRQASAIRDLEEKHFDFLVGVLFHPDFSVMRAIEIPWEVVVEISSHNAHTNSAKLHLRDSLWDRSDVRDLTSRLTKAESGL